MRRIIILSALVIAGAFTIVSTAQAQCGLGCLNHKITVLQRTVRADTRALTAVATCFAEHPVTLYGDPSGTFGYVFDQGNGLTFDTTALDATQTGDSVSAWLLYDQCNTAVTANHARAADVGGLSALLNGATAHGPLVMPYPFVRVAIR